MKKERETLFMIAMMALMGGIGGVAFFCTLFGMDVAYLGLRSFAGFAAGLGGIFFALLLPGNFD